MIHDGMAIFLWPASFVLPNMLRACNDVKYTMVVSIFSMITFRIGFSYLFGVHMGWMAVGVWAAMVIDWVFRVICFVGRYLAGKMRSCGANRLINISHSDILQKMQKVPGRQEP